MQGGAQDAKDLLQSLAASLTNGNGVKSGYLRIATANQDGSQSLEVGRRRWGGGDAPTQRATALVKALVSEAYGDQPAVRQALEQIADSDRKVLLILDNLKVHHAKDVTKWLSTRQDKIEVFYLPPYSPEINPDEYLNRDLKTTLRLGSRSKTKGALLGKAQVFMEFLQRTPKRISAYFTHPAVRYAS